MPPSPPDSDDEPEPEPEPKPEPEPFWVDQQRVAAIRLEAEVAEGGRRAALLWRYALLLLRILRRWQVEGGDCMEAQESLLRGDEEESEEEGGEESHIVAGRDGMQRRAGLPRRGVGAQVMDTALEVGRHTHGGDGQIGNRQLTTGLKGVMADASDDTSVAFKFEKACATLHPLPHSQPQPHSLSLSLSLNPSLSLSLSLNQRCLRLPGAHRSIHSPTFTTHFPAGPLTLRTSLSVG